MAEFVTWGLADRHARSWQRNLPAERGFQCCWQSRGQHWQPGWEAQLRRTGLAFTVLLLLIMGACGPGQEQASLAATPTPIPVPAFPEPPTYTVQLGDVIREVAFTARLAPLREAGLYFRADGHVATVRTTRGAAVRTGQLLAELDDSALQRSLEQAEHDLGVTMAEWQEAVQAQRDDFAKARIRLQTAEAKLTAAEAELARDRAKALADRAIKRAQLEKAQALDPAPETAKAEVEMAKARIDVAQAQARYDAVAWRNDVAASAEAAALERATLEHDKALASYEIALQEAEAHRGELAVLREQVLLAEAEVLRREQAVVDPELLEAVELARMELEIQERGVDPKYKREVAAAQLKVADLKAQQEEKRLIAPFAGEVMVLSIVAGRSVEAYEPVLILAEPGSLEIRGELAADLMRGLHEGQPVRAVPLIQPERVLSGTIRQLPEPFGSGGQGLLGEADSMVHVDVESLAAVPGDSMQAGDLVRVTAVVDERRNVLWLHPAAIREFAGRKFVVLQEGTGRRRADVLTGVETDERVEIVSGLSLGQIVEGP